MIKKNDILVYKENLEEGDDFALMIASFNETPSSISMVEVQELNTTFVLRPTHMYEAKYFKVIGHADDNDMSENIVRKFLPKEKWIFTNDLFERNFEKQKTAKP